MNNKSSARQKIRYRIRKKINGTAGTPRLTVFRSNSEIYAQLTLEFGAPAYDRIDAPATPEQKRLLAKLAPSAIQSKTLAGSAIKNVLSHAPGNNAPIGGIKVTTENGWFAARPSGTEDIYKIYAESFLGADDLRQIVEEAQAVVDRALASSGVAGR